MHFPFDCINIKGLTCHDLLINTKFLIILFIGWLTMRMTETIPKGEILPIIIVEIDVMYEMMCAGVNDRGMRDEFT